MSKNPKPRELTEAEKEFMVKIGELADEAIKAGILTDKNIDFLLNVTKLILNPDTTTVVDIEKERHNGKDELIIKLPVPKKYR